MLQAGVILSHTSEYAIRASSYIALRQDQGAVRSKDMSAAISIPSHYLSKVLRKLVEAGILVATKGHNGGFILSRPPSKIRLLHILEAVEAAVPAKHCIFGWRMCDRKEPCVLHHRWNRVNEAFQKWARTTSLEDIRKDAVKSNWIVPVELNLHKKKSA